jgi:hypothetical protein
MDILTDRGRTISNLNINGQLIGVRAETMVLTTGEWYELIKFQPNMRYIHPGHTKYVVISFQREPARYEPS